MVVIAAKNPTLAELSTKINDLVGQLETINKDHEGKKLPEAVETEWKRIALAIDEANGEYASLSSRDEALAKYGSIREAHADRKSVNIQHGGDSDREPGRGEIPEAFRKAFLPGDAFIKSQEYKDLIEQYRIKSGGDVPKNVKMEMTPAVADLSYKALLTSDAASGGSLFRPMRLPTIQEILRPALRIVDLLPAIPVQTNSIEYVRQNLRTNNAAVVPEATSTTDDAALKPESALGFEVVTDTLQNIAHMIPATRQVLADAPQLRAIIDNFLRQGLLEALEANVIAAILAASGILTQAKGADTTLDALYKAATKVRVSGFVMPQSYLLHPNDWQDIRLAKDANGQYLMGPPTMLGGVTVWGLPVVESQYATEGTGVVADWSTFGAIYEREQIQTYVTDSHSDWFRRNLIAILMEMRAKLAVYRAASGCKITGI